MKKFIFVSLFLSVLSLTGFAGQKDTLRILAIGNSFSCDALNMYFGDICAAAGKHVVVGNLFIGGCSLERHLKSLKENIPDYVYYKRTDDKPIVSRKKSTLEYGVADEPWDIVTFQQASPKSGKFSTYEPFLGELVEYVKANVPEGVRLMWHQTWAYHANSANPNMRKVYGGKDEMYNAICGASKTACDAYGMGIIPSGTAIQNAKTSWEGENMHRDGSHLNYTIGRFTVACTWFESIFGESVVGNAFKPEYLAAYRVTLAQNAAHLAVKAPFSCTNMAELGFAVPPANFEKVPEYKLPDALTALDGSAVSDNGIWMEKRRPELLGMFENEMFGRIPDDINGVERFEVLRENDKALDGRATFREVRVHIKSKAKTDRNNQPYFDLLVCLPNKVRKAPVFLGINAGGNHTVTDDEWVTKEKFTSSIHGIRGGAKGADAESWPLEQIIDAGYGVVTFYCGDVAPDYDNSFNLGVFKYGRNGKYQYPAEHEWGNIAAWAWGLSRSMDYLETDVRVNAGKVMLVGTGNFGRTALWAAAKDTRFSMVVANDSGCCGAALSRRRIGETVASLNMRSPYLFCENFKKYYDKEDELPFDQHELLSLIAPRPLMISSCSEDIMSDPEGERLSVEEAQKVYDLFGAGKKAVYYLKSGPSALDGTDWDHILEFAKKQKIFARPR